MSVGSGSILEGDGGQRLLRFPVTLNAPGTNVVTVDYTVGGGTAAGGLKPTAGVDYKSASGTVTFKRNAKGVTPIVKYVAVKVFGDTEVEGDETVYVVPPLNPDVTIVHAQRADAAGDTQVWGLVGSQKEAAFAARRVIVVVEELVDEAVVRADPNRTVIPGHIVDAVVVEPCGAHPSYAQGHYDRDNAFYLDWDAISRDPAALDAWLDEWVHGLSGRAEYVERLGAERIAALRPGSAPSGEVDYGSYA